MNGVVLLLALATPTVDYGWRTTAGGGVECIVQVEPALLSSMVDGDTRHASARDIAPSSAPKRFILQVGRDALPRETLPASEVSPATYAGTDPQSFPNASLVRYGWRALDNGEVECLLRIDPRLAQAVLEGRASAKLVGGEMPQTDRRIQFVVQVSNGDLPRDAVTAKSLIQQVGYSGRTESPAPRPIELATADHIAIGDDAAIDSGRTVFETQLQLRRGGADSQFESSEQLSPRSTTITDNWNDRSGGAPIARIGDTSSTRIADSRFSGGSTAGPATGLGGGSSRYGGAPQPPREPAGGLQIRYGDTESQGGGLVGSQYGQSPTAGDAGRYQPTTGQPYTPAAPPLGPSSYAAERQRDQARTPLAPTQQPLAPPAYTGPQRSGQLPQYGGGQNNYAPRNNYPNQYATGQNVAGQNAGGQFPVGGPPNTGVAQGNDPRVAARGSYAGPFAKSPAQNSSVTPAVIGGNAEGLAADKLAIEKLKAEKLTAETKLAEAEAKLKQSNTAGPQSGTWIAVVMLLLLSLAGNMYLGHTGWTLYRRYRAITDDMRAASVSSSFSDDANETPLASRRRRRGRLAARY